ncbi:RNA polymerase sigma factor [Algibacter sp. AS12]|uniref:RNA polymerase sigma factor n=1 Tax=Algibacter sp. AS12 TaxID=3135773 RepID=UPI00398BB126
MKKKKTNDGVLVQQFQLGNNMALTKLVKRWHKTFCEKAYWLVKDADVAKDIAQETWNVIIAKIDQLKTPDSFGGWALRIVYTKSLNWIKTNKRLIPITEESMVKQVAFVEESDTKEAVKVELLKIIQKLPERQQVVIRLFYLQEYSLREISELLNVSEGTVKSRLFHAREKLKQILKA